MSARVAMGEARTRVAAAWQRRRRLGESDCEEIRSGLIAQPVNAASSLAYLAGGGWVLARGVRAQLPAAVAFGGLLGAVGAGSVLYHGPCPPGAQQAHDTSLAATLGLVVLHNTAAITRRNGTVPGVQQLAAAAAAALPALPRGRFTNPDVAVLGIAAIVSEVVFVRSNRSARPAATAAAGTLALGALVHALGRTGGPPLPAPEPPPGSRDVAPAQRGLPHRLGEGSPVGGCGDSPIEPLVRVSEPALLGADSLRLATYRAQMARWGAPRSGGVAGEVGVRSRR